MKDIGQLKSIKEREDKLLEKLRPVISEVIQEIWVQENGKEEQANGLKLLMEQVEEDKHDFLKHITNALLQQANSEMARLIQGTTVQASIAHWDKEITDLTSQYDSL